ncbi:lipid droplet-associated hydrolase isoform X1 [Natator depressus]|uniref:lipid droplet-associated hydrolase isoform X1 n=3 Tax=Natator depressus TaxID=27790 RepID=UPI003EBC501F
MTADMLGAGAAESTRPGSEEQVPLYEEFIYCCGAATQVLKCGPWKDLLETESKTLPRLLFLIIPGNPGLAGYYRTFIRALYHGLNGQYPVWVVSHAGHCKPPSGMGMTEDTDIKELEDVFGLHGQIEHKLDFLRKNVPKDMKLVLIGHSIGCYITLEMMKRASELQVLRSVLLFPTIERMAQSPQGKLLTPVLCKLRYVLYMPVYLLSFLPERVKTSMVRFVLRGLKCPDEASIVTSLNLFSVDCVANVLYMASQEMMKVVERDSTTIKQNLKKLIFYYGVADNWCPQQYFEEIKMDFPDGDIRLCEKGIRHAFVLDASREMAAMITDWVQDILTRL